MEVVLVVGAGLVSAAAALALTGGEAARAHASVDGRVLRGTLLAVRVLERLGRCRLVSVALGSGLVQDLARGLAGWVRARGGELSEGASAAAAGCGLAIWSSFVTLAMGSPAAGAAGGALVAVSALGRARARRRREREEAVAAMPGVYRTLSLALGSGQTLAQAVAYVGMHDRGPAAEAFARLSLRLRCGMATEDAVGELARELEAPGAGLLAAALVISHRTGSPLGDLLMRSAALAERQGELGRLLGVKTAQVRLSVRVVCLLPAAMVCVLALVSPDFQAGLVTPLGAGCVALAALLDGVALLVIRHMVREVL